MADKYLNETGIATIRDWANGKFALDSDLDSLSNRVDEIVAEGGEPNVIETVKVNGTALTPTDKAVDITVPTKTSDLTNDGDGTSNFATESYVDTNGGKIDKIKVNGTEQTITNKEVDLSVAQLTPYLSDKFISINQGKANVILSNSKNADSYNSLEIAANDSNGTLIFDSMLATWEYVAANGGKIDKIKVNGTEQTITNKEVDITVPTQVSDLTNDENYQTDTEVSNAITTALANSGDAYQTASEVESAINTAVASAYKYKGSVATVDDLPASATVGDVYDVQATGMNYAWNGTAWDALGQYVDTSVLWTSVTGQTNTLEAMTVAEINAILNPSA